MYSTTKLEDYFDFLSIDDIRLKGHRIGIDHVLEYYLDGYSPEEIQANLPSLNLEEIHATITYYLHNKSQINYYLERLAKRRETDYQQWNSHPSPLVQRLRAEKARRYEIEIKE